MANTIGKFRKGTKAEMKAWENAPMLGEPGMKLNLYPLHGLIVYNNIELAVEKTGDGIYEVHAPDGQHFTPDVLHTMLCDTVKDLRDRLRYSDLEPCNEEC
jgi:hypothetical protein